MQTVNQDVLLTSIFEKQIAIRDLADQLANEFDDIKNSDRSKAVAIRDLADKQQEHLNELENKLDSIEIDTTQSVDTEPEELKVERANKVWEEIRAERIEKLDQELIDLALQIQAMDEDARNFAIASIHAIERREARSDDLKPQDYKSLFMERGDKLESCIRTLEEIKAIADLLTMSTGDGIPDFYDNTLENIGCLIINRVKAAMDEINTEPVVSQEEHGDR